MSFAKRRIVIIKGGHGPCSVWTHTSPSPNAFIFIESKFGSFN